MLVRALLSVFCCLPLAALGEDVVLRDDFESGETGSPPAGWFVPTRGYRAELDDTTPSSGSRCAKIAGEAGQAPFGNLLRVLDAAALRGKRVRLRAAIRSDGAVRAQLWLRVDRPERAVGFFDNMSDRPVTKDSWDNYVIEGRVAKDATQITLGLMVIGTGAAWLDDVSVEVVESAALVVRPPRPLEGRALENLVAFTKLLGFVRFFHPSDEAAAADWAALAVDGVERVESAKDAGELAAALEAHFQPVAPTLRVVEKGRRASSGSTRPRSGDGEVQVTWWRHNGFGAGGIKSVYSSERVVQPARGRLPRAVARPGAALRLELGAGVTCFLPTTLYRTREGTYPQSESPPASLAEREFTGDDRSTRLACVALTWTVLDHFYPYFDVVGVDWDAELRGAMERAAVDADAEAFTSTLRRLVAALRDGHGYVSSSAASRILASLPLDWAWIEERLVITAVAPASGPSAPRVGDVVLRLDGRAALEVIEEAEREISAATAARRRLMALQSLRMTAAEHVTLELESSDGATREVEVAANASARIAAARPEAVAELEPGIVYLDIDRLVEGAFAKALPRLAAAKQVIFDLRGYPSAPDAMQILAHVTTKSIDSPQWHVPLVVRPGRGELEFTKSSWPVQAARPSLAGRCVFITDASAISAAETFLGIVEHWKLAPIVGEPTAATNGNVNTIELPAGYRVAFTGMRVLKQDGSRHHGIGVLPTHPAQRTIAGVRAGRDELLDRAVELARERMRSAR